MILLNPSAVDLRGWCFCISSFLALSPSSCFRPCPSQRSWTEIRPPCSQGTRSSRTSEQARVRQPWPEPPTQSASQQLAAPELPSPLGRLSQSLAAAPRGFLCWLRRGEERGQKRSRENKERNEVPHLSWCCIGSGQLPPSVDSSTCPERTPELWLQTKSTHESREKAL